ncbi:MAG: hypothetical protein IJW36_00395 [Clostridia bacterium]|nr:hypothetical protein [Clostridia bacterium]
MDEEIKEYEKYLLNFGIVEKPRMPKFDVLTYTDNEYLSAILDISNDFDLLDDEYLSILHLKGD